MGSDSVTIYCFTPIKGQNYKKVTIDKISIEEFKRLESLLNSGQAVSADESALVKAKQSKIRSLSNICKNKIISGFSLELSTGQIENFKLTIEDQLNLMLIENQLAVNEQSFIYHATNKPCQVYLREDMIKIVKTFNFLKILFK